MKFLKRILIGYIAVCFMLLGVAAYKSTAKAKSLMSIDVITTGTINTPNPVPPWVGPDDIEDPIPTIVTVGGANYPGTVQNWNDGDVHSNINIQLPPGTIFIAPITIVTTTVQGGLICVESRTFTEDPDNEGKFIVSNGVINCLDSPGAPPGLPGPPD